MDFVGESGRVGMNWAFVITLGPTVAVAIGYVLVLRAMGLQPPYLKLAIVVAMLGLGFWWIKRRAGVANH